MIKIDINSLESEKQSVIMFYKKQIEAFRNIKKEAEKVQWADSNYDDFVSSMNLIGGALSQMLQAITNGTDVYVISDVLPLAREYLTNSGSDDTSDQPGTARRRQSNRNCRGGSNPVPNLPRFFQKTKTHRQSGSVCRFETPCPA